MGSKPSPRPADPLRCCRAAGGRDPLALQVALLQDRVLRRSNPMARARHPRLMPRAGVELAPLAAAWAQPFAARAPLTRLAQTGVAAVVIYGSYQVLLSALRSETLRRRGLIQRDRQLELIRHSLLESLPQGAAMSAGLGLLVLLCPWLAAPMSLLSLVGLGKASLDLFHAVWDGLDAAQQRDLLQAAHGAGVNLRRWLDGDSSRWERDLSP